ncbi:hypothetical protein WJX74_001629 [Apatococcus lobatus]|uniref:Uncharacterized protein n=1 Tax=Apatococcus lobatus TaxID=904363 RepID=A0AAW1RCX5_9CHLO
MMTFRGPRRPPPAAVNYDLLTEEQAADLAIHKPAGAQGVADFRSAKQREALKPKDEEEQHLLRSRVKLALAENAKLRVQLQLAVVERQQTSQAFAAGIMALTPQLTTTAATPARSIAMDTARSAVGKPSEACIPPQTTTDLAAAIGFIPHQKVNSRQIDRHTASSETNIEQGKPLSSPSTTYQRLNSCSELAYTSFLQAKVIASRQASLRRSNKTCSIPHRRRHTNRWQLHDYWHEQGNHSSRN